MKIGIYSPYVPKQLGGGEKYIFDVARMSIELGHSVTFLLSEQVPEDVRSKYEKFLGVSLEDVQFTQSPIGSSASFFKKLKATQNFDVLYLVTDGSLFLSLARKNVVHIQIPFTQQKKSLIERVKLWNWSVKNTNSAFTKAVVEKAWNVTIPFVHYPMIELPEATYESKNKEKIILSVGRFFDHLHSKRQDVMVEAFRQLIRQFPNEAKRWKLILVGPVEDKAYADKIANLAKDLPVEILHNATRKELETLYSNATFYWHAAGFEVQELLHPEKVEHFGISTVESMNYGCVPIVLGKGGQVEVLGNELKALLWESVDQLVNLTASLISDKEKQKAYAVLAVQRSKNFNKAKFVSTLKEMLR
ncbi:hypothetical protein BH10PAT2_BH10PAT2_1690 [soil metagenome]